MSPVTGLARIQETQPKWWNILFATVTALWSLATLLTKQMSHTPKEEIHTRPKLCHLGLYVVRATLFCVKFRPGDRAGVFI